jgi:hypothetical protein
MLLLFCAMVAVSSVCAGAAGQEVGSGPAELVSLPLGSGPNEQLTPLTQDPPNAARVSVHGLVKNAVTGEPLPRALVRIEGDAAAGALTDGDGRFEIPGVPVGPQSLQVLKPGFRDVSEGVNQAVLGIGATNSQHSVQVMPDMADLVFAMSPTNSIRGQIELSSGDPAQGIGVMLLRKSVQDGRAVWQAATNTRTNSDGVFRFAGLADGIYAIYTEPAMDTDLPVSLVAAGQGRLVSRAGYASVFYPEARDVAGAGKIQLAGGQQAQANMLLTQEPFRLVRATVVMPGAGQDEQATNLSVMVLDAQGHQLPYGAEYDKPNHAVQAFLPEGAYSFLVTAMKPLTFERVDGRFAPNQSGEDRQLAGAVDFSVSNRAVTNLRIPLAPQRTSRVQVSVLRTNPQQAPELNGQGSPIVVTVSQAGGWISDGMVSSFAEGYATGPLETSPMAPGMYWAHVAIPQKNLCEGSFTAGGASLAREPLVLGLSGATAPLTLTLRDDCASLKLSLPLSVEMPASGDEPGYSVYVIPDFDSTADVTPVTLRPWLGGTFTLNGLTPGNYHVFVFAEPVELEYRNREAMAQLPQAGQAVTLTPLETASVVLEVPKP